MSGKRIKLISNQTIDLSNDNGDANDGNDGNDGDGDGDVDDDGYVTGDSADVSDEDEYLQNKGCDTIVSARQTTRPATRIVIVRVFSVLKHSLSLVQMHKALEDRTEIQCKMRYNHRNERLYEVRDPNE